MAADEANASGGASDPDDWFSEPGAGVPQRGAAALAGSRAKRRTRYQGGRGGVWSSRVPPARVVAFGAGALALLLLVLAVSGVFSGNGSSPPSSSRTGGQTAAGSSSSARKGASGSPVSLPGGILTQGSSGERVKQLQLALASAGHSPGPADGVFGLTADGVYGAQTKTALRHALSSG